MADEAPAPGPAGWPQAAMLPAVGRYRSR